MFVEHKKPTHECEWGNCTWYKVSMKRIWLKGNNFHILKVDDSQFCEKHRVFAQALEKVKP